MLRTDDINQERSNDILNTICGDPTYVNRGDGRVSNHIPDVVHLSYGCGGRRCGRQHHLARHPLAFSR